ncbi:endonuclease domain-containing protein [Fulvivirga lutea]|uniref:Endonuclease domain-containing protein n=1 Tax=Fulvivirga lutea TaxID=2810512 RepID=A0A974WJ33_9BACT|nr:endonuclease domain-containing protein [Fulvivirga lutea]QSE98854.1 endonuclease domain-containing protein [Fulvivirga lutea]
MKNKIIPYNPQLVPLAKRLRRNMTLSEVLLWQEIKNKQLGVKFSRQIPIDNYIVDFYCKEHLLAIEVDGASHTYDDAPQRDTERQNKLEALGVKFIRFDDLDIKKNLNWVMNELYHWINNNVIPTPNPSQEGNL